MQRKFWFKFLAIIALASLLSGNPLRAEENDTEKLVNNMKARQVELDETVKGLEKRIQAFNPDDPKKDNLLNMLGTARDKVDALKKIDPESEAGKQVFVNMQINAVRASNLSDEQKKQLENFYKEIFAALTGDPKTKLENAITRIQASAIDGARKAEVVKALQSTYDIFFANQISFAEAEQEAVNAINAVNRELINPSRPGTTKTGEGGVPSGDIVEDFIPGLIRLLFRFAYVGILIALTASGVYMIISYDNEDRVTKAKSMIYYSLVGFAFITLAFAIVKAVTNINFFGFI